MLEKEVKQKTLNELFQHLSVQTSYQGQRSGHYSNILIRLQAVPDIQEIAKIPSKANTGDIIQNISSPIESQRQSGACP